MIESFEASDWHWGHVGIVWTETTILYWGSFMTNDFVATGSIWHICFLLRCHSFILIYFRNLTTIMNWRSKLVLILYDFTFHLLYFVLIDLPRSLWHLLYILHIDYVSIAIYCLCQWASQETCESGSRLLWPRGLLLAPAARLAMLLAHSWA